MKSPTDLKGMQVPTATQTAGGENRSNATTRHRIEITLWIIGFILFVISCVIVHSHPAPYPIDLSTTRTIQNLPVPHWVDAVLEFPSVLNNPIPSAIALALWFFGMGIVGLILHIRGKPTAIQWFQAAAFILLTVGVSAGVNYLADALVNRPRPNPKIYPIHVYTPLVPVPTYPSGHTEHDVAYYGFLLYMSLTKPIREWRYRWLLLPLQIYAVLDILSIGYSRILEGDHWLTDVLSGYLEGFLLLFVFIALYRWTTEVLAKWRAKKQAEKAGMPYKA